MWVAEQFLYIGKNHPEGTVANKHECIATSEKNILGTERPHLYCCYQQMQTKIFPGFLSFFFFFHGNIYDKLLDTFARHKLFCLRTFLGQHRYATCLQTKYSWIPGFRPNFISDSFHYRKKSASKKALLVSLSGVFWNSRENWLRHKLLFL